MNKPVESAGSVPEQTTEAAPPTLGDEAHWYTEHAALVISTVKWAVLGAVAAVCVGLGTRLFLWALSAASAGARHLDRGLFHAYFLLPLALPLCVWLIRTFTPTARGHGTEAVIAAVHQDYGRVDWRVRHQPIRRLDAPRR